MTLKIDGQATLKASLAIDQMRCLGLSDAKATGNVCCVEAKPEQFERGRLHDLDPPSVLDGPWIVGGRGGGGGWMGTSLPGLRTDKGGVGRIGNGRSRRASGLLFGGSLDRNGVHYLPLFGVFDSALVDRIDHLRLHIIRAMKAQPMRKPVIRSEVMGASQVMPRLLLPGQSIWQDQYSHRWEGYDE